MMRNPMSGWFVGVGAYTVVAVQNVTDDFKAVITLQAGDTPEFRASLAQCGERQANGTYLVPGAYYVDPFSD